MMSTMGSNPRRVLLHRGSVYAPETPDATAMLTVGGTVAWVGGDAAASSHALDTDQVVDLRGRLVTPGFVDAHTHLATTGFAAQSLDLSGTTSLTEALDALGKAGAAHRGPVLFAHGWDETRWSEGRAPTMNELDRAVGGRVAYVARIDTAANWADPAKVVMDMATGARTPIPAARASTPNDTPKPATATASGAAARTPCR